MREINVMSKLTLQARPWYNEGLRMFCLGDAGNIPRREHNLSERLRYGYSILFSSSWQLSPCFPLDRTRRKANMSKRGQYDRSKANPNSGMFKNGHPGMPSEENPNWKGDAVGYTALHMWLYGKLGQPQLCEVCGSTNKKKYEWANISGLYKREVSDWKRLCTSCHRNFDGHGYKAWDTRRKNGTDGKAVRQLDKKGNIVASYPTIMEASRVTKIHNGNISEVLNEKRKSAGGYKWELVEGEC